MKMDIIWNVFINSLRPGDLYPRTQDMSIHGIDQFSSLVLQLKHTTWDSLTHWGRVKMDANFQTTFSKAFSWMKMYKYRLRFHWSWFPRIQITIFQHWFRWWLGTGQATSHPLNQWWLVYWCIYASLKLIYLYLQDSLLWTGFRFLYPNMNIMMMIQSFLNLPAKRLF